MPFRLTRQLTDIMSPVGVNGIFRHCMIYAMSSLRKKRNILLDFCEVFINDPLLDWIKSNKDRQQTTLLFGSSSGQTEQSLHEENESTMWSMISEGRNIDLKDIQNPQGKIDVVKLKLIGMKSSKVMLEELAQSKHAKAQYYNNLKEVVVGMTDRYRSQLKTDFLTVIQQVDCLIDHCTDPNILGRTWIGWSPFI